MTEDHIRAAFIEEHGTEPEKMKPGVWNAWEKAWQAGRAQALDEAAAACTRVGRRQGTLARGFAVQDCFEAILALRIA